MDMHRPYQERESAVADDPAVDTAAAAPLVLAPGGGMAEARFDIVVNSWWCVVSNHSRKLSPGRKVRQRSVIHLRGVVDNEPFTGQGAGVALTFERGARDLEPTATTGDDPAERVRVEAFMLPGQEAAALAILQSGYQTWARFEVNALGQAAFTLESGPEPQADRSATPEQK